MAEVVLFRPSDALKGLATGRYPLGLIFLSTPLVKKGYKVKIIDTGTCLDWRSELLKSVDSSTICAGASVTTGLQVKGALDFAKELRKINPRIPMVWGGVHPTILPEETLRCDLADAVVIGEGEEKFLSLVERLKNRESLDGIKGIIFKEDGQIRKTEPEDRFIDMNKLSFPAYELVDLDYYTTRYARWMQDKRGYLDLHTDRGCPYRCGFCYNIEFNKRSYRAMSAVKVLDMIEEAKRRYNVSAINIVSDNFFVNKRRVYDVCKGIVDRDIDIRWCCNIRIDTFEGYDDELIRLMKKSGCSMVSFGVESGSDTMLREIKKDITVDEVLRVDKKIKRYDFMADYYFMIGFPEEAKRDIIETLRLIEILGRNKNAVVRKMQIFRPYPGTPLYYKCLDMGFSQPKRLEDWTDYNVDENSKLPWFDKKDNDYIKEVQYFSTKSSIAIKRKTLLNLLIYFPFRRYCRLRLLGIINGIRLGLFDVRILQFLESLLTRLRSRYRT